MKTEKSLLDLRTQRPLGILVFFGGMFGLESRLLWAKELVGYEKNGSNECIIC